MFMLPKKHMKYGSDFMYLRVSRNTCIHNAYIYCGKDSDRNSLSTQDKVTKPNQAVALLYSHLRRSNLNIMANNLFS